MKRYEALRILAASVADDTIVVGNVGPISREWNALRPSDANLLQVNLGLCSAVGLGLARALPHRKIVLLDGDGNLLMNLASLADAANQAPPNIVHIVLDNGAYEGGGGLPSVTSLKTNLSEIARGAIIGDDFGVLKLLFNPTDHKLLRNNVTDEEVACKAEEKRLVVWRGVTNEPWQVKTREMTADT